MRKSPTGKTEHGIVDPKTLSKTDPQFEEYWNSAVNFAEQMEIETRPDREFAELLVKHGVKISQITPEGMKILFSLRDPRNAFIPRQEWAKKIGISRATLQRNLANPVFSRLMRDLMGKCLLTHLPGVFKAMIQSAMDPNGKNSFQDREMFFRLTEFVEGRGGGLTNNINVGIQSTGQTVVNARVSRSDIQLKDWGSTLVLGEPGREKGSLPSPNANGPIVPVLLPGPGGGDRGSPQKDNDPVADGEGKDSGPGHAPPGAPGLW